MLLHPSLSPLSPGVNFGSQHGDILTVSLIAIDQSNNRDTCTVDVFLNDNEAPQAVCPTDVTLGTSTGSLGDCEGEYTWRHPVSFDNCNVDIYNLTIQPPIGPPTVLNNVTPNGLITQSFDEGTTTLTYTVIDDNGNQDQCTWTVTVIDDEAPTVVCPADATFTTSNDGTGDCSGQANLTNPTPTDNCDAAAVIELTVTVALEDGTGNWTNSGQCRGSIYPYTAERNTYCYLYRH